MRAITIGGQAFEDIRVHNAFYIDKTSFIREWWESRATVTSITRPRRFGKTLNMNMLECFFSQHYAGRSDLFEGLSIWEYDKYREMQGTYPVISLSFADVKENNFEGARRAIVRTLQSLFRKYTDPRDRDIEYEDYVFSSITPDSSDADIAKSVQQLSDYLYKKHGKKVLILLDEYDTPLQEAFVGGYWDKMSDFIRSFFNSTFKTNPSMERAVMTGITRVSKESIFSDFNNPAVVTTTSTQYETAFGFTEEEVFRSLEEYGLGDQKENVKKWYDGFTFGNTSNIYNPWSIINFLKEKRFAPYWANTSGNGLISYELRRSRSGTKDQMISLMNGGTLQTKLNEQIVFSNLDENEEALWSLFVSSGYFKIVQSVFDGAEYRYSLAVTNFEVQLMFKDLISLWFNDVHSEYGAFMKALLSGDTDVVEEFLGKVLLTKTSFFDSAKEASENEQAESFYHGLVLGMVAQEQDYYIQSNGESGLGRYDVMMIPKAGPGAVRELHPAVSASPLDALWGPRKTRMALPAVLLEFKIFNSKKEKTLEETAARALGQIEDRGYAAALEDLGYKDESILKYGFGFSGKRVAVKKG